MKIRYQKQLDMPGNRMCGAAALCMVYDSFRMKTSQLEIWPRISKSDFEEICMQERIFNAQMLWSMDCTA
jgi:hypothetical protein